MRKSIPKQFKNTAVFLSMCFLGFVQFSQAQCTGLETSSSIAPTACDMYMSPSGKMFMMSGTYMDTIPNAANCDSVITIDLTVNNSTTTNLTETACDSYTSNAGNTYMASGTYTEVLTGMNGCDSSVVIDLTIITGMAMNVTEVVCGPYTSLGNTVYTMTGMYNEMVPGIQGCAADVALTIDLTVNNSTISSIVETHCITYTSPSGMVYDTTGIYMDTIPNMMGCDSVITIDLTINMPTMSSITELYCGTTYTAPDGQMYSASGTYTAIIPNMFGCDSTITIDLTIAQSTTSSITVVACSMYQAPDGVYYNTSGTYMATIPNAVGCDSIITIDLTINIPTTAVATLQGTLNLVATPAGLQYQWIDCASGLALSSATNQIVQPMNGSYAVIVIDSNNCRDTSACVAVTMASLDETQSAMHVELSPNPGTDFVQIQFESAELMSLIVRDLQGKVVLTKGTLVSGELLNITSFENGVYFVELIGTNHTSVQRLVKQ